MQSLHRVDVLKPLLVKQQLLLKGPHLSIQALHELRSPTDPVPQMRCFSSRMLVSYTTPYAPTTYDSHRRQVKRDRLARDVGHRDVHHGSMALGAQCSTAAAQHRACRGLRPSLLGLKGAATAPEPAPEPTEDLSATWRGRFDCARRGGRRGRGSILLTSMKTPVLTSHFLPGKRVSAPF